MTDYYTPDPRPKIQKATRFFARPESFTLECPHCGRVYQIRMGPTTRIWDPRTSRFSCLGKAGCQKTYLIGILAWPIGPVAGVASQTPTDQVPHPRQLAQLRKEGGGWWLPDEEMIREKRPSDTNITLEEDRPDDQDEDED